MEVVIANFLLSTGWGSVVTVIALSAALTVVVWYAIETAVALLAWALWQLYLLSKRPQPSGTT